MKVVILAGGVGTRLSEETETKPKPMVEIGPQPILWHIMKHYASHGFADFIVCLGYRGDVIKRYFSDAYNLSTNLTFDFGAQVIESHGRPMEDWRVTLVDTGQRSETAGRILRIREFVEGERFMLTYGDGVSNVDLTKVVDFHERQGKLATLTAVRPVARFGHMELEGDRVDTFVEKPQMDEGWINGGYFVLEPGVFDHITRDEDFAKGPLPSLAAAGELAAYRHDGFWQCMDTLRDKLYLNQLWDDGVPPWLTWDRRANPR